MVNTNIKKSKSKKKLIIWGSIIIALIIIIKFGCETGDSSKIDFADIQVVPSTDIIEGDLKDYVQVTVGKYDLTTSEEYGKAFEMQVKLNVIKSFPDIDKMHIDNLTLTILKDNGMPVSGFGEFKFDGWSSYDKIKTLKSLLKKGEGELIATFYMKRPYKFNIEKVTNNREKIKKFNITSVVEEKKEKESSSETSSSSSSSSSRETTASTSGPSEWDGILDNYEELYDEYFKLLKKAKNNDMSALSEYPKVYKKMIDLGQKLENAGDDLTTEQITRFMEIQMKAIKVAAELSK